MAGREICHFCPHLIGYNIIFIVDYLHGILEYLGIWSISMYRKRKSIGVSKYQSHISLYFFSPHTSHCNINTVISSIITNKNNSNNGSNKTLFKHSSIIITFLHRDPIVSILLEFTNVKIEELIGYCQMLTKLLMQELWVKIIYFQHM